MFKTLLKDLAPPIMWRFARQVYKKNSRTRPINGLEMGPSWYDANISETYYLPYYKSHYYPLWTILLDRINRNNNNNPILEVGCGTGQFASMLSDSGITAYRGFDFSVKRVELARKNNVNLSFFVADALVTDLFQNYKYATVVCTEVLEHISDDLILIKRIPFGKKFYGTVPNFSSDNHVRYFASTDEVAERYKEYFSNFSVVQVKIEDSVFFIFEGVTI